MIQVVGQQEEHVRTHSTSAWASLILVVWFCHGFHVNSPDFENYKTLSGAMNVICLTNILCEKHTCRHETTRDHHFNTVLP